MAQPEDARRDVTKYRDRREAGRILAERLRYLSHALSPIVLALPRGGVPVGFEVAEQLGAALDVMLVRKLGVPQQPELAMGAIAGTGYRVLNPGVLQQIEAPEQAVEQVTRLEREELQRRLKAYRGDLPLPTLRGRTVILVDDGIATGATVRVAAQAVLAEEPARLVIGAPVAPLDTLSMLRRELPEVVCPLVPGPFFGGVGVWYEDFTQTTDEEVRDLLRRSRERVATAER